MKLVPLVSVLMPAYNAEMFVEKAIRSILNQSWINIELLLADDGSTDRTREILDEFLYDKRVSVYHNEKNIGYLLTTNKLFSICHGDFITFMDADDWSDLNRLELMVNEFKNNTELGCVGSSVMRVDFEGKELGVFNFEKSYEKIKNEIPMHFPFVGSALMVKREVVDYVGFYNVNFNRIGSEDLYWGALIILKFKMINIEKPLYFYRDAGDSVSRRNSKSIKGQLSKELAQIAIRKIQLDKTDIFHVQNKSLLKETMNYLFMKYNFWNDNYFTGIYYYLKSLGRNSMRFIDKLDILGMYTSKKIKNIIGLK